MARLVLAVAVAAGELAATLEAEVEAVEARHGAELFSLLQQHAGATHGCPGPQCDPEAACACLGGLLEVEGLGTLGHRDQAQAQGVEDWVPQCMRFWEASPEVLKEEVKARATDVAQKWKDWRDMFLPKREWPDSTKCWFFPWSWVSPGRGGVQKLVPEASGCAPISTRAAQEWDMPHLKKAVEGKDIGLEPTNEWKLDKVWEMLDAQTDEKKKCALQRLYDTMQIFLDASDELDKMLEKAGERFGRGEDSKFDIVEDDFTRLSHITVGNVKDLQWVWGTKARIENDAQLV